MGKRTAGEGSIYFDATHAKYYGVLPAALVGKRIKTRGFERKRDAQAALEELRKQHLNGVRLTSGFKTLGDYLDYWLVESVTPARKPQTLRAYTASVERYIKPHIGRLALLALGPEHVQAAQNALLASGLAPSTIKNHFRAPLSKALNQAMRWGLVARNVVRLVDAPAMKMHRVTPLSIAQCRQLLAAVAGHRLEVLYRVALALGLRRGELLALNWRDFDAAKGTLTIRASLGPDKALGETKTASGMRVLELSSGLVVGLQGLWALRQVERTGKAWKEHGLIFCSEVGTPLGARNLYRHYKATIASIEGFPDVTFHCLRHTCAAMMLSSGYGLEHVKQQLGHSSIGITSNTYGHLLPGVLREATGRIDGLLTG